MEHCKPIYMTTIEEIQNRSDKSKLAIHCMEPEKLLVSNVASPEQVKNLWLDLSYNPFSESCDVMDDWIRKYDEFLCQDLVNFNHLETLTVYDLNLDSNLWVKFAQYSTCLKEINFISNTDTDSGYDEFHFSVAEEGLDAICQIPTLETIVFERLELPYFPKGPSNLKHVKLNMVMANFNDEEDRQNIYSSYSTNFLTHANITTLYIDFIGTYFPFSFCTLRLEELKQLEKLEFYENGKLTSNEDFESLKAVLTLPNLKTLTVSFGQFEFEYNKETNTESITSLKEQIDLLKQKFYVDKQP